jgi:hypothetical protein
VLYLYGYTLLRRADSLSVATAPEMYPEGPRFMNPLTTLFVVLPFLTNGLVAS